jgi:hypothetical protein
MPVEAKQIYEVTEQSWKVLTEVTFPTAKTPEIVNVVVASTVKSYSGLFSK